MTTVLTKFFYLFQPFQSKHKPKALHVLFTILVVWIIALVVAILPILPRFQSTFVDKAFLDRNPFFATTTVDFESAQAWIVKLTTFDPQFAEEPATTLIEDVFQATSWYELQDIVQKSSISSYFFQPERFLG